MSKCFKILLFAAIGCFILNAAEVPSILHDIASPDCHDSFGEDCAICQKLIAGKSVILQYCASAMIGINQAEGEIALPVSTKAHFSAIALPSLRGPPCSYR